MEGAMWDGLANIFEYEIVSHVSTSHLHLPVCQYVILALAHLAKTGEAASAHITIRGQLIVTTEAQILLSDNNPR